MNNRISSMLVAVGIAASTFSTSAIPAKPGVHSYPQPDGTTVSIRLIGDEHSSYYMTTDGYALRPDTQGYLRYLITDSSGALTLSDFAGHDSALRGGSERDFLAQVDRGVVEQRLQAELTTARMKAPSRVAGGLLTDYPTIGSPRAMVLLVEFSDERFHTPSPHEAFTKLMTEHNYAYNGATGSARDYFEENSGGLFTPDFEVFGPITLENTMASYGASTANSHDVAPWQMVADACRLLKAQHPEVDFSQFDNDNDGVVDNIFVFYAGYGENAGASSNTVWPHSANLSWYGLTSVYDGVKIDNYACTCELNGTTGSELCGIGTFCHEFSHVLGLPDIYSTNYNTSAFTPGAWELMDVGPYNNNGNTPPYMCAYDRMTLRWLNPRELTAPETVELKDISCNEAFIVRTVKDEEYFIFENRQQHGWDTYVPGHGMLAWHIDYDATDWKNNVVNNQAGHQRIDIVEADGTRTEESRAGDPFPGRNNVRELTDDSSPAAMTTWTGIRVGKPITDIKEVDGIISFKILGGGTGIERPTASAPTDVTPTSLRARWTGSVTITDYEIDLCRGEEVVPVASATKHVSSSDECYYDFTGLEPSTSYTYVVRSVDGDMKSANSNAVSVTTLDPTFDMLQVAALDPTEICGTSFKARWEPIEGADHYLLSVYQKLYVTPVYETADFTGGLAEMPEGWSTTATSTSAVAGTFGEARPSLLMKTDQDILSTRTFDYDINSLSFWYGGNSAIDGTVEVQGYVNNSWTALATIAVNADNKSGTYFIDNETSPAIPMGCRALRLIFHRTGGSLYLDDVKVGYNGKADFVYAPGYEDADMGAATSHIVTGLTPMTNYFYTVVGVNGEGTRSAVSDEIATATNNLSAIAAVTANGLNLSINGRTLTVTNGSTAAECLSVTTVAGVNVATVNVGAATTRRLRLAPGAYVVTVGDRSAKILVK